jgi:hypothetical protein
MAGFNGANPAGAVFVFSRSGSTWSQVARWTAFSADSYQILQGYHNGLGDVVINGQGTVVAISNDPTASYGNGQVSIFGLSGTTLSYQTTITAPADVVGSTHYFGCSIGISDDGTKLLIGGYGDNSNTGAVWEYQNISGTWTKITKLNPEGTFAGEVVALSNNGQQITFGIPGADSSAGGFYTGAWEQPAYTLTPAANNINEGSSLTFTVSGSNITNGTYYWTINNTTTSNADFSAVSGSFTITSNSGSFSVTPTADVTTEGAETFTASIRSGSISGTILKTSSSVTINDTST